MATAIKPDIILASLAIHKIGLARERIPAGPDADAIFKAVSDNNILLFSSIKNAGPDARSFEIGTYYPSSQPESINTVAMPDGRRRGCQSGGRCRTALYGQQPVRHDLQTRQQAPPPPQSFPNSYANYVVGGVAALYLSVFEKNNDRPGPVLNQGRLPDCHAQQIFTTCLTHFFSGQNENRESSGILI